MKRILTTLFLIFSFFILTNPAQATEIHTTEKLIVVDTGSQTLTAWNEGKIQHTTKVSTGMKKTPTVKGTFPIYWKIPMKDMRGPSPYKHIYPSGRYHLKNVPHVMFFHQGYAIHGAYWHNNFGRVASHGCVNVPLASAEWLFNFADVGTKVVVY
jgi:lipoprotein-anchoring transpeptidase ErfK/SrfK